MHHKTKHARKLRRGGSCRVEPIESRTLLANAMFGFGDFRHHDSDRGDFGFAQHSGSTEYTASRLSDRDAAPSERPQRSHHDPVYSVGEPFESFGTLAVIPAASPEIEAYTPSDFSSGASPVTAEPRPDLTADHWRDRDKFDSSSRAFGVQPSISETEIVIVIQSSRFDASPRGGNNWNGNNWGGNSWNGNGNGNRNPGRGASDTSVPREGNTATSARPGQVVIDAQEPASGPAMALVLRPASSEVVKSIFSNDPILPHVSTYAAATVATPVLAAAPVEQNGRSVLLYLSTVANSAKPILITAKAAAAQVVGENVVHAAEAGTELAMASAASILPSPYRAAEIVRMGSPMMLVADSIGAFIEESVSMATLASKPQPENNYRAWLVTGAVVAADLILLSYCFYRRRQLQVVEAVVARRIYG